MGGKATFGRKSWVHPQRLLRLLGIGLPVGVDDLLRPFRMATGSCPVWGVLCTPSCVRDGVTRGLSWQHSHVSCRPNTHPSCKHQRRWYSRWVIATLQTLLFFLCVVTGIEKRGLFVDELNPQYSPFQTSEVRTSPKNGCPALLTPWTLAHQAPLSKGFS